MEKIMSISYTNRIESIRATQLKGFFVGWSDHPDPEAHLEILRGSFHTWLALDKDKCVGFINALSDGVFYAYIPLLEVLPKYQSKGIGKKLAKLMLETLKDMYAIDIVCDESVAPFYDKLGLSRCVGMIKRNHENQGTAIESS
jgi:ribosomal protein S18 acetylase RimI-like enzyme